MYFPHDERNKVIPLFLKYNCYYGTTTRDLDYLLFDALRKWYEEYLKSDMVKHN